MPARTRQYVLGALGLRGAATVNRGMAAQLLARARADEPTAQSSLLRDLTAPVASALDEAVHPDQWAVLLNDDDSRAALVLAEHTELATLLDLATRGLSPALLRAGLASAIASDTVASAVALALLGATDETAAAAHAVMADQFPGLPAIPLRGPELLSPAARLAALGIGDGRDLNEDDLHQVLEGVRSSSGPGAVSDQLVPAPAHIGPPGTTVATDPRRRPGQGAETVNNLTMPFAALTPLQRAEDVLEGWEQAATVAGEVATDLAGGRLPDRSYLQQVLSHVTEAEAALDELGKATGGSFPRSREGLRDGVGVVRSQIDAAAGVVWLQRLRALQGPASVQTAIDAVRSAASAAIDDLTTPREPLAAVLHVLDLIAAQRAGELQDFTPVADAQAIAVSLWPGAAPLVTAAAMGFLTVPPAEQVRTAVTPAAPSSDVPASTDDDSSSAVGLAADISQSPESALANLVGAGPSSVTAHSAEGHGNPEVADAGDPGPWAGHDAPSAVSPSLEVVTASGGSETSHPSSEAAPTPAVPDPFNLDFSGLDAALSAGVGAALSAVGSSRRRPGPGTASSTATSTAAAPAAPAATDPGWEDPAIEAVPNAVASLMKDRRFGLAADVLEAAGAPPASVAARRLAAYADALAAPTGLMASAFAELSTDVSRVKLAEDRPGQLLALAAAARVALLAPSAGPASVLLDLLPSVGHQPALSEAIAALADASRTGIVVVTEAADAVGTLAATENRAAEAARDAEELLASAGRRTIKYIPANGVYQAWMHPDGPLGQLLGFVAANDASGVRAIRDLVVSQRGRAAKAIDQTFVHKGKANRRIHAGARATLLSRWDEALDLAVRWADLAAQAAERTATLHAGAWQVGTLSKLRQKLAEVRDDALQELAHEAGRSVSAADVDAAVLLLTDAFAVCDGDAPGGTEPPPEYAAHAELLATELPLSADTLLPDGGLSRETLPSLLAVAAEAPDAETVYVRRAGRGDHDLTAALVAGLRAEDPASAAVLDRRRVSDITDMAGVVDDEVTELRTVIDTRRLAGSLDDAPWTALSARAGALDETARRDFGRVRVAISSIRADLETHKQRKIEATLARIAEHAQTSSTVADAAEVLSAWARAGQIASVEEHLQTTLAGHPLPSPRPAVQHLQRFFPIVPAIAAMHGKLLMELRASLSGAPMTAGVQKLIDAGLDSSTLPEPRRDAGRKALGAWSSVVTGGRGAQRTMELANCLRLILDQAGLEFGELKQHPPSSGQSGRQWLTLHRVTAIGRALTPALGSAMSPDGTTLRVLLVRSAPSPTTVLEWMSGEARDQTVLVLWTGPALTPTQRRAVADAARGRTRPPLMWLDAATLSYLVCQPEPRRSTFAEIALPFTAASPYRDTPGDTPPEMFYGRTEELAAVVDLRDSSFVSGGRQLGKSALLRVAQRRFTESGAARQAVLTSLFTVGGDGKSERIWMALWPHLARVGVVQEPAPSGPLAAEVHAAVLRWLDGNPGRALLILLDEADAFLDADAVSAQFEHVDWCRKIMLDSRGRVKFVFAGLHRTARFESLPNQPLAHLGRPITVGPLRPQHAHELLSEPLAALGFRFAEGANLPARILATANNMPALLQLFGEALMAHLTSQPVPADGPPQLVTEEDVDAVFADADLREAYRDKYVLTLNLDHRYLVITYAIAAAAHELGIDASLSLAELSEDCRAYWLAGFAGCGADDFRGLVTECVDLGVLAADDGRYRLRTPSVLRLLGTEDEVLETLYGAPDRLVVPSASDAGSFRRQYGEAARSPLTERQLGRLFDARREVMTITGSAALGGDGVLAAVEAADRGGAWRGSLTRCHNSTPDGLRAAVAKAAGNANLVLADFRGLPADALDAALTAAEDAVRVASVDVTVALVVGPGNACSWVRRSSRIDLARVDEPGLRLWSDEVNLPFRDEGSRARLAAVTGSWPKVIAHTVSLAAASSPGPTSTRLLEETEAWLGATGGDRLVADAGIGAEHQALRAVFTSAAYLGSDAGEEPHDLVALLDLEDGVDLGGLARESGFTGIGEVVDALMALGCLAVTSVGTVRAEPVLAGAAFRQASATGASG